MESKTNYIVGWEDESENITYNEPFECAAPLLDVAFLFRKEKKAQHPDLKIRVKSITVLPLPPNQ